MSLVCGDYGDSSEDEGSSNVLESQNKRTSVQGMANPFESSNYESDEEKIANEITKSDSSEQKLYSEKPIETSLDQSNRLVSVFTNPFREAEKAEISVLERHVKMTSGEKTTNKNSKRNICWNISKHGKCPFGNKCRYFHPKESFAQQKKKKRKVEHEDNSQTHFCVSSKPC